MYTPIAMEGGLVQFISVRPPDRMDHQGDTTDESAEILFQSFLQEAFVSNSSMGGILHSLVLSTHTTTIQIEYIDIHQDKDYH